MKGIVRHVAVVVGCCGLMLGSAYGDSGTANSQAAFGSGQEKPSRAEIQDGSGLG